MLDEANWPPIWPAVTDDEIETIAAGYIWGAEKGDEGARPWFAARLDHFMAEAARRGKPELIDRARASLVRPEHPCDRAAAREENWSRNLKFD